jgi:RHS repeat-associated protein
MLAEKYAYDVFGQPTIFDPQLAVLSESAVTNRFLFTGRERLDPQRTYDYRNRVYSPVTGRFVQADPMSFAAGDSSLYRYVGNRATSLVDPLGLEASCSSRSDVGNMRRTSASSQIVPAGTPPDALKWWRLPDELPDEVDEIKWAARITEKVVQGVQHLGSSAGFLFSEYLQLEFECCRCRDGKVGWVKEAAKQEVVADEDDNIEWSTQMIFNGGRLAVFQNSVSSTWRRTTREAREQCKKP